MTIQAVEQYFDLLTKNEEFAQKIIDSGENKETKLKIIKDYGMNFTKDEFEVVAKEYAKNYVNENGELTEEGLESVSGGLVFGALIGAGVAGSLGGLAGAGLGGLSGGVVGGAVGLYLNRQHSATDQIFGAVGHACIGELGGMVTQGALCGAAGATVGVFIGLLLPF